MNKRPMIIQLPDNLANMIAAGEVVERPASIIKELVENSLDAKSTIIKVDLIDSGMKKITIIDNGIGMTKEEIPLALKRHATSKIKTVDDLFRITSLGFRGEALPSIGSVSHMTIISSTDGLNGYLYEYEGLRLIKESTSPLPQGTKITIENLFYNTPARLKHLSNASLELSYMMNYLNKFAIANPDVAFIVTNNGKTVFQTTGKDNLLEIIATVYGYGTAKNIVTFKGQNNLYQITGYTTNNSTFRSNKNGITIIVNKRLIKNQVIIYAIIDAYKTILPVGKYPITILNITTDPSLIDVNVHPSKLEIRFTDENLLKMLITSSITSALANEQLIYSNPSSVNPNEIKESIADNNKQNIIKEEPIYNNESLDLNWEDFKEDETKPIIINKMEDEPHESTTIIENEDKFFIKLNYLGQYHLTYLLMEYKDDLYLIDQHAAMERCMYEKICKELINDKTSQSYELIVPIQIDLNMAEVPLIMKKEEELTNLGIKIEPFGGTTIIVRCIPTWIPKGLEVEFLSDIINHLINDVHVTKAKMYDSLAKSLSCKKSIKGDTLIRQDEVNNLMVNLDNCKMPYTCPHGRPIMVKFTLYELEKMFKRIN